MRDWTRISVIEIMRGFSSISVALFHISGQISSGISKILINYGWLGVDVFFVISGFVIPLSLYGRGYTIGDFPSFMLRRLVRLEPPYLASIALAILLWHASSLLPGFQGEAPSYSAGQIASHLFYAIPLTNYEWINPVYWSLAYEFVFYIIVGLCFCALMERAIFWTVLLGAAIASILFALQSAINIRPLEFLVGALIMRFAVDHERRREAGMWIVVCLAVAFFSADTKAAFAISLAAASIMFLRKVQFRRWAYWIGGISYSLYLTHATIGLRVVNLGKRFGDGALYEMAIILAALAVSIGFAALFVWLIEMPAINASRKIRLRSARAHLPA